MKKYAVLLNPGHNRVYFMSTLKLAEAELNVVLKGLSNTFSNTKIEVIANINYITFECVEDIENTSIDAISKLSFYYALFEMLKVNDDILLKPINVCVSDYVSDSISSILKYTGKTNELFTRMMINIALANSDNKENINLLDPIAGKGTTLYEGAIRGFNTYGIEIGDKVTSEAYAYMKKFLTSEKLKHDSDIIRISGENKSFKGKKYTITYAKDKEEYKNNKKEWCIISGDSRYSDKMYKKNFFDILVGDLPYGVQHSNVTMENQSSFTRNPSELLRVCLPSWYNSMKSGGALVLAWNTFVLPREKMIELLEKANFKVLNEGVYTEFSHRVDNAIMRDIVVAKKI